jgi:hypothetical protein
MALREDIRDPGASREWEARIAELQHDLIKSATDWVDLLPPWSGLNERSPARVRPTPKGQAHALLFHPGRPHRRREGISRRNER